MPGQIKNFGDRKGGGGDLWGKTQFFVFNAEARGVCEK